MNTSVSTRVEIAQTEMKLVNIKEKKSYNILFPFSLSCMGYKTLVETQHNNSGAIHSQPDVGSKYNVRR